MNSIVILFCLIGIINADGKEEPVKRINFLETGTFDQCEGKDSSNYTYVAQFSESQMCTIESNEYYDIEWLIASQPNGGKIVNTLKILARSSYPAGAYYQQETLYLSLWGNLEGKYVYIKEIGLREAYLKKCSSILGYSYVSTKSQTLLISEKIDMPMFLNPTGASDPFQRTASTVCKGRSIIV